MAVSVVSLLTVGYVADNYEIATEWMSKEKFLAAVAVGIGIWGVLSKEFVDAYFSSVGGKLKLLLHNLYVFDNGLNLLFCSDRKTMDDLADPGRLIFLRSLQTRLFCST